MAKYTALYIIFIFSIITNSVNASITVKLDDLRQIEIIEQDLWFQTQPLGLNPSFLELEKLLENASQVDSTLGGSGAYATKIKLINTRAQRQTRFVNLYTNYLDIGSAYWQSDDGKVLPLERFGQTDSTNPKLTHSQAFPLTLNSEESGTLWIYIQAKKFTTPVTINIYSQSDFYDRQFFINSITSISYAVMMILALIAYFIYLRTKYVVTLACAGYIGLHGIGWFAASGSLGHLLTVPIFNPVYAGVMLFPFAIAFASQFTKLLFDCQKSHIKLAKVFNALSVTSVTLGLLMLFLPFNNSYLISHIIAMVWIPLCIGTGIFMLTKKDFRAKYYLTGNLLYALALALYISSHAFKFNWDISAELIVLVALTIDCICILLSLSEWLQIQQNKYRRSYSMSRIDPLTQVGNRLAQDEMLESLTGDYCFTFIDLDGFKKINDELGHDEGDKFLIATVDTMKRRLQGLGTIFRCGGDEFIIVVSVKTPQQAASLLMKLSNSLLKTEKELQQTGWQNASFSFGIATSFETTNQTECLSLADQRMYKHKKDKKNAHNQKRTLQ